ncbi:MAG: calcium/sodium antiporter [Gammaproteobacteria bacterium]|nr:calcium/sodium antiporter [Gammaproteobacteria bacterium]
MLWIQLGAVVAGLAMLVWSAGRFVDGAAATAWHLGVAPLLIGILVIGFGTSAPELTVSVFSAAQGNSGLALGNAYGSNIANIGLILGVTALVAPITVRSAVLRRELPLLLGVTLLAWLLLADGRFGRADAAWQLGLFTLLVAWSVFEGLRNRNDPLAADAVREIPALSLRAGLAWTGVGLVLLVVASRVLVWGAVGLAQAVGVSDLVIGLTVVAVGTSLPELASALVAARRGEHELALGNVLGSNLFNTLLVASTAAMIAPGDVEPKLIARDLPMMAAFTVALLAMGLGLHGEGRINRVEGTALVTAFCGYTAWLAVGALG